MADYSDDAAKAREQQRTLRAKRKLRERVQSTTGPGAGIRAAGPGCGVCGLAVVDPLLHADWHWRNGEGRFPDV